METELIDDSSEVMTGEAVALELRPTGFVLRAAGAAIDFIVYVSLWLLVILGLNSPLVGPLFDDASAAAAGIASLVFCTLLIPMVVETATQGKSLGRLAVGTRIVRDDGGSIALRHAFVRALMGLIEIYLTFGGVAAFVGLLNARSKRLGDLLAGTYSQNERLSPIVPLDLTMPAELADWATIADVARMPDGLSRRIAQFLRQSARLTPESRMRLGAELSREASAWVSPLPIAHPEAFLVAAIMVRREREATALAVRAQRLELLQPVLTSLPHGFPRRVTARVSAEAAPRASTRR
ncbi:MAG: RDD family protein [Actinomycetota bacterium]